MLAAGCWQAATVHFSYGGNWTALFCTGSLQRIPPELAQGTYVFGSSAGYDGQFYRYLAHDPWFRKGFWRYQDAPTLRCRRILLPALAWLLAAGRPRYIDAAYVLAILLSVFLGTYWLGRYAVFHGRHPAWGLGFLAVPATLISIDRLTVDVVLVALCAGFAWYVKKGSPGGLYVVLVLAGLARETGLLLVAACCLCAIFQRHWRRTLLFATTALPALIWFWCMPAVHVPGKVAHSPLYVPRWVYHYAGPGMVVKLFQPETYPGFAPLVVRLTQAADVVSLCGLLAALGLAAWGFWRWRFDEEQWATLLFVGLALAVGSPRYWANVFGYGRPFSPLVFLLGLRAVAGGPLWMLAPAVLMDLRIGVQLTPQVWRIVRGLL
jgi:hypothetical protein